MEGFRGISLAQDSRFKSADKKLLAKMKFAPELDQKVDLNKVEIIAFRVWVAQRITSILGFEDEVVVELVFGHLETPAQQGGHESTINPKDMQIQLTGFLGAEQGMLFMKDLWALLLSAQANCKLTQSEGSKPTVIQRGVPTQFIEEKQKAYEQEKRRIAALAEKKLTAVGGSRDDRDAVPSRADSYNRDRDVGRDSSRAYDRDDVKRQYDRDSHRDSGRAAGSRGISNTPAWMVAESANSKRDDGDKPRSRSDHADDRREPRKDNDADRHKRRDSGGDDSDKPRSRSDHADDRREPRKDNDADRHKRRDSGGESRGSKPSDEGKDKVVSDCRRERRRDDDRDRSQERDSRRDSGRRDRSRDRQHDRRRSRSGSRDRRRKDRGSDVPSSRRDEGHARRSRRSRSPVISSSSSGGSLSPASK